MYQRIAAFVAIALTVGALQGCAPTAGPSAPSASPSLRAASYPPHTPGDLIVAQIANPQDDSMNVIAVMQSDGTGQVQLAPGLTGDLTHPDWSPDGDHIAFVADGATIMQMRADGTDVRTISECSAECVGQDFPAYSHDGRSMAYTRYTKTSGGPPTESKIVVRDLATGHERFVATSAAGQVLDVPRWSPDDASLVVGIDRFDGGTDETGSSIGVVPAAGGAVHELMPFASYAYYPNWNTTTGWIVFDVQTAQFAPKPTSAPRDLFLIRADGTGLHRLTHVKAGQMAWHPSFTPDGTRLLAVLDSSEGRDARWGDPKTGVMTYINSGTHPRLRP